MTRSPRPALLVCNAGSATLKLSFYNLALPMPTQIAQGLVIRASGATRLQAMTEPLAPIVDTVWPTDATGISGTVQRVLDWAERSVGLTVQAATHRIVHGGDRREVAVWTDESVIAELEALTPWAPLHQPLGLAPLKHLARCRPTTPQMACFDTAFHQTLDPLERPFGLPRALLLEGVRRYGFHGLSYEYIATALAELDPDAAQARTLVAHLGHGASVCALDRGVSRATSMGLSTLDGLIMGTRCGRLDPGVLLYLLREHRMTPAAIEHLLYHDSGVLGLSGGLSSDMRVLAAHDHPWAREAVAVFVRSVVKEIGALAAAIGGIDTLVLTGGVGEHLVSVRESILRECAWLGLQALVPQPVPVNARAARLSRPGSKVSAWVIPTDENFVMARHSLALLSASRPLPPINQEH